jgi:hypothetical protein
LPALAFLLSIVGLSVSLSGFSGLLAAFKRGLPLKPMDAYRLRQIPEMALAAGFIALMTLALADTFSDRSTTIRIAGATGLLFTLVHAFILIRRMRTMSAPISITNWVVAATIDLAVIAAGIATVIVATPGTFEWLLVLMIARPGLAFLLAMSDVTAAEER